MKFSDLRKVAESFVLTLVISVSLVTVAAHAPPRMDEEHLRRKLAVIEQQHEALETWIAAELRPWVLKQTEEVVKALPSPHPSIAPLPPPPVMLSPAPTPSPSPGISASPSDIPSPTCIPAVGVCIEVTLSPSPSF